MNFPFFRPRVEIEVIHAYLHKLPKEIRVSLKKDEGFLIGAIKLKEGTEPIFVQAKTPQEFVKMVNQAVYIALDFKREYIEFFHDKGDVFVPSKEAMQALENAYGKKGPVPQMEHAFGFESKINEQFAPVAA